MTSDSAQETQSLNSPICIQDGKTGLTVKVDLRDLPLIWSLLTAEHQKQLLSAYPEVAAILDSLVWMSRWTKTRDDQDQQRPFKPLNRSYFKVMHEVWLREKVLYVEKSRSMVTSWWAAAEAMHMVMTAQPAKAIFWAQDEDRAVVLRDYVWTLYEQQSQALRDLYPVPRPRMKQSYDKLEFSDGGMCLALPGKDPDKIRSEHPTVLVMDEACFIENGGEAFDVALASRVPKILLISTAAPSWIRRVTKTAVAEEL